MLHSMYTWIILQRLFCYVDVLFMLILVLSGMFLQEEQARKEWEEQRRRTLLEEERQKFEDELKVQMAQSVADSEWLRREEKAFSVSNGNHSENVSSH